MRSQTDKQTVNSTMLTSAFPEKVPVGGFPAGISGTEASELQHRDNQGHADGVHPTPP